MKYKSSLESYVQIILTTAVDIARTNINIFNSVTCCNGCPVIHEHGDQEGMV